MNPFEQRAMKMDDFMDWDSLYPSPMINRQWIPIRKFVSS